MGIHVMMFPWFAYGHIIPFIQLSNKLAEKGHKITFLIPTKSKHKIQHLNRHPNLITLHPLTIPQVNGLPAGAETTSDVSSNLIPLIAVAMDRTRDQVEDLINSTNPNVVFHDFSHWLTQITKPRHIKPSISLLVVPHCLQLVVLTKIFLQKITHRKKWYYAMEFRNKPFGENLTFADRIDTVREECEMFAIRTCREIEGQFCDFIMKKYNKPVLLTGPTLLESTEAEAMLLEEKWANWLSGFEDGSVVLCVFGSESVLEKDQFQEFLLGFESSGYPFLIALKPPVGSSTVEEAFPIGFEERIKGRGLVSGEWVPQQAILKHSSVGCFVNHCGAASMWESLLSACQIVVVPPLRRDFIVHARLLASELEVSVEVEKEENGWVSKEKLSQAIKCVMDRDSGRGDLIRKNHDKWKEILDSPGFVTHYFDTFVRDLEGLVI